MSLSRNGRRTRKLLHRQAESWRCFKIDLGHVAQNNPLGLHAGLPPEKWSSLMYGL
jgi:hypothetical protein